MERGVYRGVYSVLMNDPDFRRLSPQAKLVFYTLRLSREAGPGCIFVYDSERLPLVTGMSWKDCQKGLSELQEGQWVLKDQTVMWIRNGLRYDPHLGLTNPKHRLAVIRNLTFLPKVPMIAKYCEYYDLPYPFDRLSNAYRKPIEAESREERVESRDKRSTTLVRSDQKTRPDLTVVRLEARKVLDWLNQKAGKNYRPVPTNLDLIKARLESGITIFQLRAIVSRKVIEWQGDVKMAKFLRPETLFNKTKCEQYLGELPPFGERPVETPGGS